MSVATGYLEENEAGRRRIVRTHPAEEGWRATFVWWGKAGEIELRCPQIVLWAEIQYVGDGREEFEGFVVEGDEIVAATRQDHFQHFLPPEGQDEATLRAILREHMVREERRSS